MPCIKVTETDTINHTASLSASFTLDPFVKQHELVAKIIEQATAFEDANLIVIESSFQKLVAPLCDMLPIVQLQNKLRAFGKPHEDHLEVRIRDR